MEFMFFSKYISCDSTADLLLMDLIDKTEFNKHHKVIHHMFIVLNIQNINKYFKQHYSNVHAVYPASIFLRPNGLS